MRAALLLAAALAGCSQDGTPGQQQFPNMVMVGEEEDSSASLGAPPAAPPPPDIATLRPIGRADIERELESGAGCSLDGTGTAGPLLVAVAGDAIVNAGGRIVHLEPVAGDLSELFRGGRFAGPNMTVLVEREGVVERVDEVTTWQATLRIQAGKTSFASFHHRWSCGA